MPNTSNKKKPSPLTTIPTTALKPGWVILALGTAGYVLSETHIFGPMLSIVLMAATIFQLNQYRQAKSAGGA